MYFGQTTKKFILPRKSFAGMTLPAGEHFFQVRDKKGNVIESNWLAISEGNRYCYNIGRNNSYRIERGYYGPE